jgi:hypothetical protein
MFEFDMVKLVILLWFSIIDGTILLHFGYKTCSVKSLNIVWKNHEKMVISILHTYKSNLGPSNSDGSNTMDGSNLFESPANFPLT